MGSKMAAASRVVQAVKPHAPLIKFPDRKSSPRPDVQEALKSVVYPFTAPSSAPSSAAHQSSGVRPQVLQSTSSVSKVQGTPDTSKIVEAFPPKYRRKLLTSEEMDYIQSTVDKKKNNIACANNQSYHKMDAASSMRP